MVTIANAAETGAASMVGLIASFIPLFLMGVVAAIIAFKFAKRKGKKPLTGALLALLPIVGPIIVLWLASLTDKDILDRLEKLEKNAA